MFRKTIFWIHLAFGIVSGLIIAALCATGAALAFEHEIVAWAERDVTRVSPPSPDSEPIEIDELLTHAKEQLDPEAAATLTAIVTQKDPNSVWKVQLGRRDFRYINPYTGELFETPATATRQFFRTMFAWHRWLTTSQEHRSTGKAITGIANLCFIGLGLTGLYLWFPKIWKWRFLRSALLLKLSAQGKTRDFNWHNVFGFWALIPILIMAITGTVFSYGWARTLATDLLGPSLSRSPVEQTLETDASLRGRPMSLEQRYQISRTWNKDWESISVPASSGRHGRGGPASHGGSGHSHGSQARAENSGTGHAHGHSGHSHGRGSARRGGAGGMQPFSITIAGDWFPLSPSRILIHPRSGEILGEDRSSEWPLNAKLRSSIKAIHTGEAGLLPGKIIAFLGCFAGLVLVYSGFALSYRRFFPKKVSPTNAKQQKEAITVST